MNKLKGDESAVAIKDSGIRREFETGAVRDTANGKGRADLLPLDVVGDMLGSCELILIDRYIRRGDVKDLMAAIKVFCHCDGVDVYTLMLDVAKQYEGGAEKYGDRNWEKGQPLHVFIDSGVRHYLKHRRGDTDEPHGRAFVWNLLGCIWTQRHKPEMIDLPFGDKEDVGIIAKIEGGSGDNLLELELYQCIYCGEFYPTKEMVNRCMARCRKDYSSKAEVEANE